MFKYGKPVTGEFFVNRENELKVITDTVRAIKKGGECNIALIGLRRTGKTSILQNLHFEEKDIVPVLIDCYGIPSKDIFANLIVSGVRDAYAEKTGDEKYLQRISDILKKKTSELLSKISDIEISISHYLSVKVGIKEKIDERAIIQSALNYPEALGAEKNLYFLLMLDEFPDVALRWGPDFVKLLRSTIQNQKRVAYIITGSAVTYMSELVYGKDSAFYRQLKPVHVGPLPVDVAQSFIKKRLDCSSEVLDEYIRLTGCLPDYIQRLGHAIMHRRAKRKVTMTVLKEAYGDMLYELDAEFKNVIARLNEKSGVYGKIILALCANRRASKIANAAGLPISSLPRYVSYLVNIGLVEKNGGYRFSDPVFENWVKKVYGGLMR